MVNCVGPIKKNVYTHLWTMFRGPCTKSSGRRDVGTRVAKRRRRPILRTWSQFPQPLDREEIGLEAAPPSARGGGGKTYAWIAQQVDARRRDA